MGVHVPRHRHRQSEGRSGEDHDRDQSGREPRRRREARPGHRHRPPGKRDEWLRCAPRRCRASIYDVLVDGEPVESALMRELHFPYLDLVPSSRDLVGAEVELVGRADREHVLREALEPMRDGYDFILIDCPPSLGLLTLNTLTAADTVLIPIQCEFYALEGLSQLLNTVRLVQRNLNPRLADRGRPADDVRSAAQPLTPGCGGGQGVLREPGLQHDDPAQRPACRGAELRQADHRLRCTFGGRAGLPCIGARAHPARRAARGRAIDAESGAGVRAEPGGGLAARVARSRRSRK